MGYYFRNSVRALVASVALIATGSATAKQLSAVELQEVLEPLRADWEMPGLRAAVRYPGGRIVRAAVGLADIEREIALDDDVPMPGGSVGKTFVAGVALSLIEEGVLTLDDPISKWVGDTEWFARLPNRDTMQVKHLLSHTSGMGDYPGKVRFLASMVWRGLHHGSAYFTPEELILMGARKSAPYAPGEGYEYSDSGYLVLGRVIEAATGHEYFDLLSDRILVPLKLEGVVLQDQAILPGVPPGYQRGVSTQREDGSTKLDPSSEWTGGGIALNPTHLVIYFSALANGRVISADSFNAMLAAGFRGQEANEWRYGYGVFVWDGGESFGHEGTWAGYRTIVVQYLKSGITVAAQTNRDGPIPMWAVVNKIKTLLPALPRRAVPSK